MIPSGAPVPRESFSRGILLLRLIPVVLLLFFFASAASAQYQTYLVFPNDTAIPAGSFGLNSGGLVYYPPNTSTPPFNICFYTGFGSATPIVPTDYVFTGYYATFNYAVPASTIQDVPPVSFAQGTFSASVYTVPTDFTSCTGPEQALGTAATVTLNYPTLSSTSLPFLPEQNAALTGRLPASLAVTGTNFIANSGTKGTVPSAVNFTSNSTLVATSRFLSSTALTSTIPTKISASATSVGIEVCNTATYSYCSSSLTLKTAALQKNPGTLTASPNPALNAQPVTLAASFGPATHTVAGAPSGLVIFSDGGKALGTSKLVLDRTATFAQAPTQQFLTYALPIAPIVADLNGDGIPDTLLIDPGTGNSGAALNLLLGTVPSGSFKADQQFGILSSGGSFVISSAAIGDFNGDGIPDLVLLAKENIPGAVSSMTLYTMLGNGDGTFQDGFISSKTLYGSQIVAGDFNKDGKQDIVIAGALDNDQTIGLQTLLGDGKGNFTPGLSTTGLRTAPSPYFGDYKVAAADFNNDGFPDIAVMNGYSPQGQLDNSIEVYQNSGKGAFEAAVRVQTDGTATANFSIARLGPGQPLDIIVTSIANPGIYVGLNQSTTAKIAFFDTFELTPVPGLTQAVVGDFDGDGLLDVAVEDQKTIHVLSGDGEAFFTAKDTALSMARPTNATLIAASDENGDTYADLLLYTAGAQDGNTRYPITLYDYITAGTATASLAPGTFTAGTHTLQATTSGTFDILPGTATATLDSNKVAPTILIATSPGSPQPYVGSTTTLRGTIIDNTANPAAGSTATGTASFYNGSTLVGTAPLVESVVSATEGSDNANLILKNLPVGTYSFTVRYLGDVNHDAAESRPLSFQVTPGTPSISWKPNPDTFAYGTPLSSAQLNAVATGVVGEDIPGTFTYAPAIGTVLTVGTHLVVVTFNPTDPNYASTTANHTFVVTQALPVITWKPDPATIPYGTALSAAQLDATSNTPGTFVYTPAAGTVLAVGTHTLSTAFTPKDTVDFSSATSTATVTVAQASSATTLTITSGGAAASSIPSGTVATLTATVTMAGKPVNPGQVNFCDATSAYCTDVYLLGTVQLTPAGTATFNVIPGIGSHSYKAVFLGTGNDTASASVAEPLAVTGLYPTSTTIAQSGLPGDYTLTATATGDSPSIATPPTGEISFQDTSKGNVPLGQEALGTATPGLDFVNSATVEAGTDPHSVVAADFNGDGKPDFAVASADHLYVFLGKGDGTFTTAPIGPALSGTDAFIASGDFNGDGKPDLVITNAGNTLTVLLGKGDGTFTAKASPSTGSNPSFIAVADLNRDGIADLVVVTNDGTTGAEQKLTVLLGVGDGTFKAAASPTFGALTAAPTAVAIGDFNEDGKVDLAVTNCCATGSGSTNGISILLGNGDGTFQSPKIFPQSDQLAQSYIVSGDINGDGHVDLATLSTESNLVVFLGNGSGGFSAGVPSFASGGAGNGLVMGDFNGDGKPDLATSSTFEQSVSVLLGNGTGGFTPAGLPVTGQFPFPPASADFNGDGVSDLVTPNEIGSASVLLAVPTQTATATLSKVSPNGGGTHLVDAAFAGETTYKASTSATTALTGLAATPSITWKPNPATIAYGTPLSAAQLDATSATLGTFVYTPAAGTILTAGTHTLSTTFTPKDTTDFTTVTKTANIIVTSVPPTVTWNPNPASISYGTALSAAQLNATSSTPGTFVYAPAAGTILTAGTYTLSTTFTPKDTTDFTSITKTANIVVTSVPPTITWNPNPASISYGTALSAAQLDATSIVPGTFVYTPAAGTILTAGAYTLSTTFTPKDTTDFSPITKTANIVVTTVSPAVTWNPNPASIAYGTALSAAQLDATSSVPGTFVYTPATGTILTAGTYALSTNFTPKDTTDFTSVTKTANIVVTSVPTTITWNPNPASISYGTALSGAQLDATSSTPGTFVYSPAAGTILPAGTHSLSVVFTPASANYLPATLSVPVTVTPAIPTAAWSPTPSSISYGTALSAAQLDATSNIPGTFVYTPAFGTVLNSGTQTLTAVFTPTDTTDFKSITITTNILVTRIMPLVTWKPNPATIAYGTPLSVGQLDATSAIPGTFVYTPALGTVLGAGPQVLSVLFTPTDAINYTPLTLTAPITVTPVPSTIVWTPNPATISYGTPLSASQLDATSATPGTFVYTPAIETVLAAGTHTLTAVFTPKDATDFNSATSTTTIVVIPVQSTITWIPNPATIAHEIPLSAAQLDATSAIPGTFVYTPALGTILTAGPHTLSVVFTPTDSADFTPITGKATIVVTPLSPTITWKPTPATIASGTALSAAQLDATSSVPGTFVYTPALGTILGAGNRTLSAVFTPTDAVDYTSITTTTGIVVSPVVTWKPNPASISYGTPLSAAQLDATSSGPGTFVYTPGLGTVLPAGTHTLSVTFTPTGATDSPITSIVSITVTPLIPAVTWIPNPGTITYGTPLSAAQLDATALIPGVFVYTPGAGTVLAAGPHRLSVTFTPTDTINYSPVTATANLLVGMAQPALTWTPNPASIAYGTALSAAQLDAASTTPGSFLYTPALGAVLGTGTQTLTTVFTPNDTTDYKSVTLTTTIVITAIPSTITWIPNPATIAYGTPLSAAQLNATSTTPGIFVYTPALGAVLSVGTQTLSVTFTPTDTTDFKSVTTATTITVTAVTPTVTWTPNPATITYGTPLSVAQLDATSTTPGTFVYTPALGTVLAAGTQTLSAVFTPTDTTDFKSVTTTATITVTAFTPALTWVPNPATITYGTALSAAQLDATSTTPGTFVYTPALGSILTAGTQTLSVAFTPTDTKDFKALTTTATITVNTATPGVTWLPNPASIPYGTALSAAQLDATSSTPGTFVYTPALGTILPAGAQTLSVVFTPTDTKDFKSFTATAILTVQQTAPTIVWAPPASIIVGTALSSTQLDATATGASGVALPGTFAYTPATGTLLSAGAQTLKVVFTPTDLADYTTAASSVPLQVIPVTLASLSSTQAALGDPAKTITLTGTGFVPTAVVEVNGSAIPTTFVNATTLTATIPAADFLIAQILQVNVVETYQNQATASIAFVVGAPLASAVFAGPSTIQPGTDADLSFKLTNPYPVDLTASFAVSFTPAAGLPNDPGVLFTNGSSTYAVVVPANSTATPSVSVQGSTVAGSMTLTLTLTAGGVDVTPPSIQPLVIQAPLAVPGVSSASITRSGNTLTVVVRGLSNPRDMASAKFHFTPVTGGSIGTEDVTIDVVPLFTTWYADPASLQYGSTFTYTQSFNLSSDASVVGQVSVTLTNSVGESQEADTP